MSKKLKKRSASDSYLVEKSEKKDVKDTLSPPKKQKLETVSDVQSANAVSKKAKKPVASQNNINVNKKKKEKNKSENSITSPSKVEQNKESQNGEGPTSPTSKKNRITLLKEQNKQLNKEKRKVFRREEGQMKTMTSKLSIEQIKEKINELQNRETLSKSAKKKLGTFKKLLKVQEESNGLQESTDSNKDTSDTTKVSDKKEKKVKLTTNENNLAGNNNKKKIQKDTKLKQMETINEKDKKSLSVKSTNKQKSKQQKNAKVQPGSLLRLKPQKDEDEDEDEDEDMEESSEEENKDQVKSQKLLNKKMHVEEEDEDDDEDDDEDEDEEEEEEEEEEIEYEDEDEDEDEEEEEEEEEAEDEDEDQDEEDIEGEAESKDKGPNKKLNIKKKQEKKNEIPNDKKQGAKKKRYVLHVANIPYSANSSDIRKYFLTKVSAISDVRIPKNKSTNKSRGFCYIELGNQEDYEKALSLNHSTFQNRVIKVQYTTDSKRDNAKQIIVAKNKKLDALRKEGKLAGSQKKANKKLQKGKKNTNSLTT